MPVIDRSLSDCRYKFVQTPLFIFESQADSVNLMGHNSVPNLHISPDAPPAPPISADIMKYLDGWHKNMSACLAEITANAPGAGTSHGVVGMHAAVRLSIDSSLFFRLFCG